MGDSIESKQNQAKVPEPEETIDSVQAAIENLKNQLKLKKNKKGKKSSKNQIIDENDLPPTPPQQDSDGENSNSPNYEENDTIIEPINNGDDSIMIIDSPKKVSSTSTSSKSVKK